MATFTSQYSPDYGTDPYGKNLDWGTSDPRKIASQSRRLSGAQYEQDNTNAGQTQDYLTNELLPQLKMTPEEQQRIVTGAGISAGTGTQAAVGAAQRAANQAGGNPLALAAYRARAAKTQGVNAGDAMTQARIGASDAAAQRTGTIANYYQGLQQQQNQNAQNDLNRQTQANQLGVSASQTPSTFDKIMGGVTGALGALPKLDEGGVGSAVVGEGGPEKIVDLGHDYMDDGGFSLTPSGGFDLYPENANTETAPPPHAPKDSFWTRLQASMKGGGSNSPGTSMPGQPARPWSPVDTYSGFGASVGKLAGALDEGGVSDGAPVHWPEGTEQRMDGLMQGRNGIFTKPTAVKLGRSEAVVPLGYRARAKVRPSMAALPAAKNSGDRHSAAY